MLDAKGLNKVILLFIFDKMEVAMKEDIIIEMAVSNEWLTYIDAKESFSELASSDFLTNVSPRGSIAHYSITSDGRECLQHFYTEIPSSMRDSITEHVKKNRLIYRRKQDYSSDYFKNSDGTYTVVLKIESVTVPLLELKLNVQSRNTAKWIFKHWSDKALSIYELIHDNLVE